MIEIITGLPGNAKTLYSISQVIKRAKEDNRPVYHAGLKEFKSDDPRLLGTEWIEFDPLKWHETVPSNSIIFIDEAQKIFRNRSLGTIPGKHVTELEEHRHKGLDFYMVTQHPSLIDPAIRKLTQTHHHMVRIWGMEASTVHKWNGIKENCDKPGGRADSEKLNWKFRKDLYGIYKSADAHTMKRAIPAKVKMLAVLMVIAIALVAYVVMFLKAKAVDKPAPVEVVAESSNAPGSQGNGRPPGRMARDRQPIDPMEDLRAYVHKETPRVAGLQHTAPKYDEITTPVRAPVPACIQIGTVESGKVRCKCYTQQGTPMDIEFNMCIQFARNGYFQDFDPERDREQNRRQEESQRVLADKPDQPMGPNAQVVTFAKVEDDWEKPQGRAK